MTTLVTESPKKTAIGTDAPFHLENSETLTLPRAEAVALAHEHQNLPRSPTERERDPKRVAELINRIKAGLLLPCSWATVLFKGVKYRMNGQHSSQAIVDAADALPDHVVIHWDHYRTDTQSGMGVLFRQFDARFSGRTKKDVAGAYQGLNNGLEAIDRRKAKLGIDGICWFNRKVRELPVPSGDDRYEQFLVPEYRDFLSWLDALLTVKTPELMRDSIIAAMYGNFSVSNDGANEFWNHVAKADLNVEEDPRVVLSEDLQRIFRDKPKTKAEEFYAKCIKAWNAFCVDDKIRNLNVNTKKGLPEIAPYVR